MNKVLFFLFIFQPAIAQKVQVIVPKQPVTIGNAFQVQYVFTGHAAIDDILPPVTDSIKMISGPNMYKGTIQFDGRQQPVQNVAFTLVASAFGNVRIKSTEIHFKNGDLQTTNDAFIEVMPPPKVSFNTQSNFTDVSLYAPSSKADLDRLINENLFIKTEVDRRSCYVGEPVVATFKLYSRLQSSSEVVNSPSLYGFSVMDILNTREAHIAVETIEGKVFNTSTLRKLQLYPEQSGQLTIDAMELDNAIEFDDSLSGGSKITVRRSIMSDPVTIKVKSLPSKKPDDYSGAVGKFFITAAAGSQKINTEQQGKITVLIKGKGNFIQLGPPQIRWPKELEVFDAEITDRLTKTAAPVEGEREYVYQFTVSKEGHYVVPPASFSFFDPAADSFSTIKTDSFSIVVDKGKKPKVMERIIAATKSKNNWWLWGAFLLLTTCLLLWLKAKRKNKVKPTVAPLPTSIQLLSEKLAAIDTSTLTCKETCIQIQRIITQAEKENKLTSAQRQEIKALHDDCQLLAYSFVEDEEKKEELRKRTSELLSSLS